MHVQQQLRMPRRAPGLRARVFHDAGRCLAAVQQKAPFERGLRRRIGAGGKSDLKCPCGIEGQAARMAIRRARAHPLLIARAA